MAGSPIDWLAWGEPAFERARRSQRPLLLALMASWSEPCAFMDREVYGRPDIAQLVQERFVAVRVDPDRRPDVADRYNLGGWPTTAFLTPDGEIIGGGTRLSPEQMPAVLHRVADAFVSRRAEIDTRAARKTLPAPSPRDRAAPAGSSPEPVTWLIDRLLALADPEYGGFTGDARVPPTAALTLALHAGQSAVDGRRERLDALAVSTLDWLEPLIDPIDGGFFRCASRPDWSEPQREKTLAGNAALIRLHLDAAELLGHREYLERAASAIRWARQVLARPEGGFCASQAGDQQYYRLGSETERAAHGAPPLDRTVYADANAEMLVACLRASQVEGPPSVADASAELRRFALRSVDQIILELYRPGEGIAHALGDGPPVTGLLGDQVRSAEALLFAHGLTGEVPYAMLAAELMEFAVRDLWDPERGLFRDRAGSGAEPDCGLLARPYWPFALNCEAACVLDRLALVSGRDRYRRLASQTLEGLGTAYQENPLEGAAYGLTVREIRDGLRPPGWTLSFVDWQLPDPSADPESDAR